MNNVEFEQLLKSAQTPGRSAAYWERFPQRVVAGLRRAPGPAGAGARWFPRLAWGLATAAACLVIGFAVGHWRARTTTVPNALLQNEKVIREMMAVFPNRIRAIVQDERGLNVVLSDRADVPDSPPLFIQVIQGGRRSSFITFSGQEIEVAGQKISVLSDARGNVMLVGDRFLWSRTGRTGVGDTQIEARTIIL